MVETLLLQMHELWEQRNADVHGKSDKEQTQLKLQSRSEAYLTVKCVASNISSFLVFHFNIPS